MAKAAPGFWGIQGVDTLPPIIILWSIVQSRSVRQAEVVGGVGDLLFIDEGCLSRGRELNRIHNMLIPGTTAQIT